MGSLTYDPAFVCQGGLDLDLDLLCNITGTPGAGGLKEKKEK